MDTLKAVVRGGRLQLDVASVLPEGTTVVLAVMQSAVISPGIPVPADETLDEAWADLSISQIVPKDRLLARLRR